MGERVLLVEDDPSVQEIVGIVLRRAGLHVSVVSDGREALSVFRKEPFDLAVLDVMLPHLDGFAVCRAIRRDSIVPVLLLTARADTHDVVTGLELGADDYLTKPFEPRELVARAHALLRRAQSPVEQPVRRMYDLAIDAGACEVHKGGRVLPLTTTEFRLLLHLSDRPGIVHSRQSLLEGVWGYRFLGNSRLVDMAVRRLRDKVEDDPTRPRIITTVRGIGYRMGLTNDGAPDGAPWTVPRD